MPAPGFVEVTKYKIRVKGEPHFHGPTWIQQWVKKAKFLEEEGRWTERPFYYTKQRADADLFTLKEIMEIMKIQSDSQHHTRFKIVPKRVNIREYQLEEN